MTLALRSHLLVICATLAAASAGRAQQLVPQQRQDGPTAAERLVSAHVAALLAEALPKPLPPPAVAAPIIPPFLAVRENPATHEVIRLPSYLVREPKLPTFREITWREARFDFANGGTLLANRGKFMTSAVKFKYNPDHHGRLDPSSGGFDILSFSR